MRKLMMVAALAACLPASLQASDWQGTSPEVRAGAFLGARLRLPIGGSSPAKAQAAVMVAPTQSYHALGGRTGTRIGDGVALDFAGQKPTLMLGALPARSTLGLREQGQVKPGQKLGISSGAWVGIGLVVAVAAVLAITNLTCIGRDRDFCGSQ